MPVKISMLFQLSTNLSTISAFPKRIAGWSESWYFPGTSIPAAITAAVSQTPGTASGISLCQARANMLPTAGAIVGQRFQTVSPVGPSQTTAFNFPGPSGTETDTPNQALLINVPAAGANNIRRVALRGIPDGVIFEGEFSPSIFYQGALQTWFLTLGSFLFRGRDLSQGQVPILTISATGAVVTVNPHTYAVGNMVRVLRTLTADGDKLGGRFQVATIGPLSNNLTLANWLGEATSGGNLRLDGIVYPQVAAASLISVNRLITRRVGRPFIQYRGRRSAKRG